MWHRYKLCISLLAGCIFALVSASSYAFDVYSVPAYQQIRSEWHSSDIKFVAANGQIIQKIRADFIARKGDWLELKQISPVLQKAVIASEDKRFYQHSGVDWLATVSAAWSSITGGTVRGASTLSMQLAAMLEPAVQRQAGGRSISRKIDQMQLAQLIENKWSKTQILEAYLNLANYRGELTGIDMLARVLFQKHASSLNLRESALTAVLLRGPNANTTVLTQRSCALLKDNLGRPDLCKDLGYFIQQVLGRSQYAAFFADNIAPHLARLYLDKVQPGAYGFVQTDIDYSLQKYTNYLVRQHLLDLQSTGITDAAVVVLENNTGKILTYVGSSGDLSQASQVDHARALRQAGSTLKPFLYASAIDQQYITAASLLNDAPLDIDAGGGLYIPDNYDHVFTGWVSARTALASSLNIPAVRVLTMLGVDKFGRLLKNLGLPLDQAGDYYGYSLALGSADVDLLSLTNAYRVLARGGEYQDVSIRVQKTAAKQITGNQTNDFLPEKMVVPTKNSASNIRLFSPEAAWITADILSDRQARARTFGLDSSLSTPYWTAVKTGTSRDMRDNWTLGWSDRYTVGVWVGNSAGASMRNVSGVSGAGPIWRDVFSFLNQRSPSYQTKTPAGIEKLHIKFAGLIEPDRTEYFVADTGTSNIVAGQSDGNMAHIVEPVDGTILALDPEIPFNNQRMQLLASDIYARSVDGVKWFINGKYYAVGNQSWWQPRPGTFVFELRDDFDKVIDRSKIKVQAVKPIKADFHSRPNQSNHG